MTPELEAILEDVGWLVAKRCSPIMAQKWTLSLSPSGGRLSFTPGDAKELAKEVNSLFVSIFEVFQKVDSLPGSVKRSMNFAATSKAAMLELMQAGLESPSDHIAHFRGELWSFAAAAEAALSRLELEAGTAKKGRQRNAAAYAVAETIASIFVVGRGTLPSLGKRADMKGLSGLYGRTVESVLQSLGIRVSDAYNPCKSALDKLHGENLELLLMIRCPVTRPMIEVTWRIEETPAD